MLNKAWQEAYPDLFAFKYPDRWRWNMLGNPFVPEEKRPLCWVASTGVEIAAWTCATAVPIEAAGERVIGAHSVDTFTLDRYRRFGLGKKLQQLNQNAHPLFIAIDPSPANRRNKYKVGGFPGKPLFTYLYLQGGLDEEVLYDSFLQLVAKYLGTNGKNFFSGCRFLGVSRLLNFCCTTALRFQKKTRQCKSPGSNLRFELVDEFSDSADRLWHEIANQYSFAVVRDASYLNWKYVKQPNIECRRIIVWQGSNLVGLLVYRDPSPEEVKYGIVSECFCKEDDPAILQEMIAYAFEDFSRRDITSIKCGASTAGQQAALSGLGFILVDIDVPVFHVAADAVTLHPTAIMEKDWLLSLGDSDIDQIRPGNQPCFVDIVRISIGKVPGAENIQR